MFVLLGLTFALLAIRKIDFEICLSEMQQLESSDSEQSLLMTERQEFGKMFPNLSVPHSDSPVVFHGIDGRFATDLQFSI